MSFFTMAASRALMAFPQVNSQIDGNEIVSFDYCDIGVAVQTPKGLMVPVLRNTQSMTLGQIEKGIYQMAQKAKENKISIEELMGGTFSITNGGTYGSLLSTPILNPPQSAILGMHNIIDRPIALNGQVVIRPMMYVALSYDHRIIDGKDSVGFLKMIREFIENPFKMLDSSGQAERNLMGI
jgi:2-oxoglutarate dehydrogenase E2 component (dihydrolipoamide succinyltransferase)